MVPDGGGIETGIDAAEENSQIVRDDVAERRLLRRFQLGDRGFPDLGVHHRCGYFGGSIRFFSSPARETRAAASVGWVDAGCSVYDTSWWSVSGRASVIRSN